MSLEDSELIPRSFGNQQPSLVQLKTEAANSGDVISRNKRLRILQQWFKDVTEPLVKIKRRVCRFL